MMGIRDAFLGWPVIRQLSGADPLGRGAAAQSDRTAAITARTTTDQVTKSVCPYCAVGCGQNVYSSGGRVTQIEGDSDSPVSRGRLCPKGAASEQLVNADSRQHQVWYRRPGGTEWESLTRERALDMIADRVVESRHRWWQDADEHDRRLQRTMGIAALGGATLDNEENYLIKKLFSSWGAIQVENQARI